ncbi:MAG: hypothetical protein GF364_01425 [Candidatus Lokiarchaeota archaeon]|nr:hypothetical protein [Candidatus Lokiarchaeota archaeon]
MTENAIPSNIADYTDFTCTNLMIKLKILTNRMKKGEMLEFLTTREGNDNLETTFNKKYFRYQSFQKEPNVFYAKIIKFENKNK